MPRFATRRPAPAPTAAARGTYGHTWWGAQWLQALTQIDHENRLPRGRSYANRGAVLQLEVKGGKVRARVQGSRAQPYVVEIDVPPTPAADAARLVECLAADAGLIGRLLNRELDPVVLEEARRLKIAVFPARWSDLGMHCSCPDWAVPCKHLAAAVYVLSREIDGDPFLVFSLRGLDLPALMRSHGVSLEDHAGSSLPDAKDVLFPPTVAGETTPDPAALDSLDFTTLPDLREPLWQVLQASPVFFRHGDFRALAQRVMGRVAREARQVLDSPPPAGGQAPLPEGRLQLIADAEGGLAVADASCAGQPIASLGELTQAVAVLAPAQLADLAPTFAIVHTMRLLALHLLAQGAVVPQVFAVDADTVALRWCAAELDPTVRGMLAALARAWPGPLVLRRAGRRKEALAAPVQLRLLLSALLTDFVAAADGAATEKPAADKLLALFFKTGRARFDGPGEARVAGGIHAWLARLHLGARSHVPVLHLEEREDGDGFALAIAVAEEAAPAQAPTPLAEVLAGPSWADRRAGVLGTLAMLTEFHPPLAGYLRQGARQPLVVAPEALPTLLFDTLPALRLMGIRTLLARSLDRLLRPRLSMQLKARSAKSSGLLDTGQLFSFDWKVSLGEARITPAEFERLLGKATGIVKFRGQYVYLDPAEVEQLRTRLTREAPPAGADLLRAAVAGEVDGVPIGLNKAAEEILKQLARTDDVPLPKGLQATLRPYQQRGYAWLWRNARMGLGSVIADDMGLGKTLQVIALLQRLKEDGALADGRALVIVPTSLLTNWQKEAERFAPSLRVDIFHGAKRELAAARPDVLLTTYGVARREAALLNGMRWRVVVIDEAQNIKNAATAQSRAIKGIAADSYVAMSGTPVENQLSEYWSIMDFAQRGYLGGPTHFAREYAVPIEVHRDAAAATRLRKVMAPFMLRRLKSDKSIIDDLPDKVEQDQFCTLSRQQAALYESVVQEGLASLQGESDTFRRQGLVLQMILALKQVCNHPAHYLKQDVAEPDESGKAQRLLDLLEEIHAAREKVLVFTQFREMGTLLQAMLRERLGHEPLFLHGGVARGKRDQLVERFQEERADRVFLLSLKAGGTGLNLTAANHVIHFDLWWNPAVEAQATDRAYRIGQQRRVQVHRFITRGTFEERINAMIRSKRELAEMSVGSGETWIGALPAAELRELFRLDKGTVGRA
jgi:uncharacterized Zn finger protein/superfamily II DNA or RNA helicase